MKKVLRVLVIVVVLVGATVGYTYVQLRGPSHSGKALNDWLEQYGKFDKAQKEEAKTAILAMNPGVQQHLLAMLKGESTEGQRNLASVLGINYGESHIRRANAARGFHALGAAGEASIPHLVALMESNNADIPASDALAGIGKGAVPALTELVDKGSNFSQYQAGRALAKIGPDAEPAIPVLLNQLKDEHPDVRQACALGLGMIGKQPEKVVDALVPLLGDSDETVQVVAAESLGRFGAAAKSALPALLKQAARDDGDPSLAAGKSVRRIDPTVTLPTPERKGKSRQK